MERAKHLTSWLAIHFCPNLLKDISQSLHLDIDLIVSAFTTGLLSLTINQQIDDFFKFIDALAMLGKESADPRPKILKKVGLIEDNGLALLQMSHAIGQMRALYC